MNKNAERWLRALRSGRYRQGVSYLKRRSASDRRKVELCCLGVACELYRQATGKGRWVPTVGSPVIDGVAEIFRFEVDEGGGFSNESVLPLPVAEWLGFTIDDSGPFGRDWSAGQYVPVGPSRWSTLTEANDGGMSFPGIADTVEEHQDFLFKGES